MFFVKKMNCRHINATYNNLLYAFINDCVQRKSESITLMLNIIAHNTDIIYIDSKNMSNVDFLITCQFEKNVNDFPTVEFYENGVRLKEILVRYHQPPDELPTRNFFISTGSMRLHTGFNTYYVKDKKTGVCSNSLTLEVKRRDQ